MARFQSLADAVRKNLRRGDTVAMEGFTHLIPFAAGTRSSARASGDLTLMRMTPDLIYDQMIGMGLARKLIFSWGGNPGVGSLHRLRDAVENGWPQPLRARGAFPRGHGQRLRGRAPPVCRSRYSAAISAPTCRRSIPPSATSTAPYRRSARGRAGDPAGRRDHSCAAGRSRRQRAASRASSACRRRRCWRPSARSSPSRRSSRTFDGARAERRASCRTGPSPRSSPCPAARIRPTRTATTGATTPSTSPGTRSRATATAFLAWMKANVLERRP